MKQNGAKLLLLLALAGGCSSSHGQTAETKLVQRVDQPSVPAAEEEEELKYDPVASKAFEDALADSFRQAELDGIAHTRTQLKRRGAMESVSPQQFEAAWRTNLAVKDQPAGEVLTRLFSELGVPAAAADAATAKRLLQRVSIERRDCSRLEIIDAVCRSIDIYPDYTALGQGNGGVLLGAMAQMLCPDDKTADPAAPPENLVALRAGTRPLPITFVGPYAIEIAELQEQAPHATGSVHIRVLQAGVPRDLVAYQQMRERLTVKFDLIEDQAQRKLPHEFRSRRPWFDIPGIQSETHYGTLSSLLRKTEAIHVKGRICLAIPTAIRTLRIEPLVEGAKATAGDFQLAVESVQKTAQRWSRDELGEPLFVHSVQASLVGKIDIETTSANHIVPFDKNGHGLRTGSCFLTSEGFVVDVVGEPTSLVMKIVESIETVEYPFELKAPLQHFPKQPIALEELQFEGDTPASVEVVKFEFKPDFSKIQFRWANRSNKAIAHIQYHLRYKDGMGQSLKDWPGSESDFCRTDDNLSTPLDQKTTQEKEATAFFMPSETKQVDITIREVKFMDASTWRPQQPLPRKIHAWLRHSDNHQE